jgi:hypothetical protein
MDYRVLQAQQWVNATYKDVSDYVPCAETGVTGWPVMYSLTRGLQHELGITDLGEHPQREHAHHRRSRHVLQGIHRR